jgi:choline kinase
MKQEFFVFQTKFAKVPVKFENGSLLPTKSNPDAVIKVSREDLIYETVIQIFPNKMFKGLKILQLLTENASKFFDRPIRTQLHILINKNPLQPNSVYSTNRIRIQTSASQEFRNYYQRPHQ